MRELIQKILANVVRHFPKQILGLRYFKWTKRFVNWKNPKDLQQYEFVNYINRYKSKNLQDLADLTDKVKVREFVTERIGEKFLTKLYGVWDKPDDIDFKSLPQKFVLKTNNGCGTNVIIQDKEKELDQETVKKNLKKWLHFPYGALSGQPHYSMIEPKILAEEYLEENKNKKSLPRDYKFFCFNGEPKFICIYEDRQVNGHDVKKMVYDLDWKPMPDKVINPVIKDRPIPPSLKEMIEISRILSKGFDFVRVDLYEIDGKPVFGEMTFTPDMINNFTSEFLKIENHP